MGADKKEFDFLKTYIKLGQHVYPPMRCQILNFGLVCGLASIWEYKLRLLCERFGINNYTEEKKRRNRNMQAVEFKRLDDVIKELLDHTSGRLNINLPKLNELRNSLIHGNLHQLRIYDHNTHRNFEEESRGNLIASRISPEMNLGPLKNLSDSISGEEAESFDLLIWFTEVMNSQLPQKIWRDFENCLQKIDNLIDLKAESFDEYSHFYENIVIRGRRLSSKDEKRFIESKEFPADFFKRIYSYFKDLQT